MPQCPTCKTDLATLTRFCPACGRSLQGDLLSQAATLLGDPGSESSRASGWSPAQSSSAAWLSSSSSLDSGGFATGTTLAGRYRIIGLLGRGGMGEVYRADDLKLGQPVALKFLPPALAQDPGRVARFYNEVRIARQVSHANVCRVYDIGELEGQHYLSMEYVDGEDLASLLRRIGRLPEDKALEVSRQLCAGLAAAHERGVLHRDLKPGNVMIDGQGKVRITDFGLAVLADEARGKDVRAGTPAYMAPEQLAGAEVTARSDIFSLGAVLYEIFTGKRAFHSNTLAEITREQESLPASPASIIEDLDPAIERAILRCLEKEPRQRPVTALQVAASLPGGDPLAAALAAGEVPSPDMVAAAGVTGGLRARRAWALLGAFAAALAAIVYLSGKCALVNRVPTDKPPAVLTDRATDLLHKLGYTDRPADRKSGFDFDQEYLDWVKKNDHSRGRWKNLATGQPATFYFWYRQSPRYMRPTNSFMNASVTRVDPPQLVSGMASVCLDGNGRLLGLQVTPPQLEPKVDSNGAAAGTISAAPDWPMLIAEAGLDFAKLTPVASKWVPPSYCDTRTAWEGTYPDRTDLPLRIEAGAYAGRPVYFQVLGPWSRAERMQVEPETRNAKVVQAVAVLLTLILLVGSVLRARHNLRLGLGDRRGASRLATYTLAVFLLDFLLSGSHAPTLSGEWELLLPALGLSLFFAALLWVIYVAVEPYVRKLWPDSIISWSRLLAGRFRDPLVGRDILLGCVGGCAVVLVYSLRYFIPGWIGQPPPQPPPTWTTSLAGIAPAFSLLFVLQPQAAFNPMALLFLLVFLRSLLRNKWLALLVLAGLFGMLLSAEMDNWQVDGPIVVALVAIWLTILLRLGLLAMIVTSFVRFVLVLYPLTSDVSHWFAGATLLALGAVVGLSLYGFYTVHAGRPLFRGGLLAD